MKTDNLKEICKHFALQKTQFQYSLHCASMQNFFFPGVGVEFI